MFYCLTQQQFKQKTNTKILSILTVKYQNDKPLSLRLPLPLPQQKRRTPSCVSGSAPGDFDPETKSR